MPLGLVERGHHENPRYESLAHIRPTVDCGPPKALARPPRPPASFTARKEAQVEAAVNDIKMIENIAREMARPPSLSVLERKGPMSLNTNQRRKELQRIDLENQRLLKRLESQKSTYSRRDQKSSYEQSRRHARLARAHRSNSPRSLPPLPSRRRDSGALPTPRSDGGHREDTEAKAVLPAGMEAEDTDGPDELPEGPVRSRPLQPSLQQEKGDSRIHSRDVRDGPDELPDGPVRSRSLQPSLQQEKGDSRVHSRDVRASRHVSPTAAPNARSAAPATGRAPAQTRVSLPRLPQPESRGSSPQTRERSAPPGRRAPASVPNKGTAAQRTSVSARPALRSSGREEHPAARREAPAKQELRAAANGQQEKVQKPALPLSPLQKEPQEAAMPEAWEDPCSPADATTVEEEVPEVVEEEDEPSSPSSLPPTEPAHTAELVAPAGTGNAAEAPTAQTKANASASPSPLSSPSPGVCGLPLQAATCAEEAAESGDEAYSEDEDFEEAEDESTPMSKGNMTGYSRSESQSEQETSPAAEKARDEQAKAEPPILQRPSGISALSQESVSQIQAHSLATKALSTSLSALAPGGEGPDASAPSDAGSDAPTSVEGGSHDIQNDDEDVVSARSGSEDES